MKTRFRFFIIGILVLFVFTGCSSLISSMELNNAKGMAKENKYVAAIEEAASALIRSEYENSDAAVLVQQLVFEGDTYYNKLINDYKNVGSGSAFAGIYDNYLNLVKMYNIISSNNLQSFSVGGANYSINVIDYSAELNAARDTAGKIYYDAAIEKMKVGTLAEYRQAYTNLNYVKEIYTGVKTPFTDLDDVLQRAYNGAVVDIYIVIPSDLEVKGGLIDTMGSSLTNSVTQKNDWVKFHYGKDVDLAYEAWELVTLYRDTENYNDVLKFGKEVEADLVIYASFDNLSEEDIKVTNNTDSFKGSADGDEYTMNLSWQRYNKNVKVKTSIFVVDVNANKTLLSKNGVTLSESSNYYSGTYTLTPDVFMVTSTVNFAELLKISNLEDFSVGSIGLNGYAYRKNYSPEKEALDRGHFDESIANWKMYATTNMQDRMVKDISKSISQFIAYLF
jgi:hypothetical protein